MVQGCLTVLVATSAWNLIRTRNAYETVQISDMVLFYCDLLPVSDLTVSIAV